MNALIYARVSTEDQTGDGHHSLDAQKRICSQYADTNKINVLKIFEDAGKSGTNIKGRPALREMLIYVQENKNVDWILVQDTDRIARNVGDHLAIKAILGKEACKVYSVSQPGIDNSIEGNLIDTILAGVNQFQSELTARKVTKGMEEKACKGWLPGRAPAGYKNALEGEKKILVIDDVRAPLIIEAFDLYSSGRYGAETINEILYNKGYRTENGKKLQTSKLYWIMENPIYYGDFRWGNKLYAGKHQPLITKEKWQLVQEIRKSRTIRKHSERKHQFLLSGFIFCKCGRQFTAEHHNKPTTDNEPKIAYSYYHCTSGRKCNASSNIPLDRLELQVEEKFKEVNFPKSFYDLLLQRLKLYFDNYEKETSETISVLLNRQGAVKKNINRVEELLIERSISAETYKKKNEEYQKEIDNIELEITKIKSQKIIKPEDFTKVTNYAKNIYRNYKKGDYTIKRQYLGFFWEKFIVEGKTIIEAVPTPLFAYLKQIQKPSFRRALENVDNNIFINPQLMSG